MACEIWKPYAMSATSRCSRNHTSAKTACRSQLSLRTPVLVPRATPLEVEQAGQVSDQFLGNVEDGRIVDHVGSSAWKMICRKTTS